MNKMQNEKQKPDHEGNIITHSRKWQELELQIWKVTSGVLHYDGTEVAITADYPGLLPASHVSNQETSPPKEPPHSTSPTALSRAPKGRRSTRHPAPEATPKRAVPTLSKLSKRKASGDTPESSSKRYGFVSMPFGSHIQL